MPRSRSLAAACATLAAAAVVFALSPLSASAGAPPGARRVQVSYVANGSKVGAGTALRLGKELYIPISAVKALTGTAVHFDTKTRVVSSGAALPAASGGTYLEDLPGQPYYLSSAALCWQTDADGKAGSMRTFANPAEGQPCNVALPGSPTLDGANATHELAVLVSADGHKSPDSSNSVTMNYDLAGKYLALSGTIGLPDHLNHSTMLVRFLAGAKVLATLEVLPGSLPAPFSVKLAHARALSLVVSNVSGAAPQWNKSYVWQYAPGAVMLANARLSS